MAAKAIVQASEGRAEKNKIVGLLFVVAVLTAGAGLIGYLGGQHLKRSLSVSPVLTPVVIAEAQTMKAPGVHVVAIPAIVTNLAGEGARWIRLETTAVIADEKAIPAGLPAQMADDLVALMRTLDVRHLSGASGFQHLREEILERMRTRSGGRVRDVTIQTMVIE
jgi:flagellar protein FliL